MAAGLADDLATTLLLATNKRVLVAPAMNVRMWQHPATQDNIATLRGRGVVVVGPDDGEMACHEFGPGRLAEPPAILAAIQALLHQGPLTGRHAIVTSGPTQEPIDRVRFIANRSSGKQGHAIAAALAAAGAKVTLISGPVALPYPPGVAVTHVETAAEMLAAVERALPADIAICAAAVADWRVAEIHPGKLKKGEGRAPPALNFVENPDILAALSRRPEHRPRLVIGFAAETEHLAENAVQKRLRKGCDWLIANDVGEGSQVMGGDSNQVLLVTAAVTDPWPPMDKTLVAERLVKHITEYFS
jgi:phosphopantothenoylcysteine decarboxylase/phosphopantothenate--cysteine ligase